ncbi:MAG: tetratricopeptide repeat protein [Chitinophagales bacterium]|nr:tetratricopeptide repeat protein [Chitinophagaceae bacterium]MCB9064843.1 tetratricopeptide repeat protein [Chitinophagales bacterium]
MNKLLLLLLVMHFTAVAQTDTKHPVREITAEDSAKVEYYWNKAMRSRMTSEQRQLYLDSALAITPWRAYFWQQKSMPLTKMFKHELAAPFLDSAVKYDPKCYIDYSGYVKCMFGRRYRDAMEDLFMAKVLIGEGTVMDHPYDFYIGICHLQLNNYDSAKYLFRKCIDYRKNKLGEEWVHHLHLFYLGVVYYEQDSIRKALETFDRALKLVPTFPDVKLYKAYCLSDLGRKEQALIELYQTDSLVRLGYDMNEDNTRHILYPYQLRKYYLQSAIRRLEAVLKE